MTKVFDWPDQFRDMVSASFQLQSINFGASSIFNRSPNIYGTTEQIWVADITLPSMVTRSLPQVSGKPNTGGSGTKMNDYRDLSGFLSKLQGRKNYVRLFDSFRVYPRGTGTGSFEIVNPTTTTWSDGTTFSDGTAWTDGAGAYSVGRGLATLGENGVSGSDNILLTGLVASQTRAFASGDLISIGNHLYEITDDAPSDASGQSRVYIAPKLRQSYIAGDSVKIAFASGVFALIDDTQGRITRNAMTNTAEISLSFVEVIL